MFQIDFNHPTSIYFVGIGGISMSGLAEILHQAGFKVSGSDWKSSPITKSLEEKGISIYYGESKEHIDLSIDCAVLTSAVQENNLEYEALRELNIPYISRAQLLGQIMKNYKVPIAVSGTHGKTTTTSMISEVLLYNDTDPTLSIGGILKSIGGNIRIGKSEYFLTEACEYTNSFLSFFPKISVILNVEADHMDFFHDIEEIRTSFHQFASLLPQDGTLIINGEIENIESITNHLDCNIITYGFDSSYDYYVTDIVYNTLGHPTFMLHSKEFEPSMFQLQVPGKHNISNAIPTIIVSDLLSLDRSKTKEGLCHFKGTNRRFELKGMIGGVSIIDDYAHHPTEIEATLQAASNCPHNSIWCVFQPHTYSRTKAFLTEFAHALSKADYIILTDIYAAREQDTLGISSKTLQEEIIKLGKECFYFPSFDETENFLLENCINGDLLITMGAGDVHMVGENLLGI